MGYASVMVEVGVTGELNGHIRVAAEFANRFQSHLIGISAWMPRPPFAVDGVIIDPELTTQDLANRTSVLEQRGEAFRAAVGLERHRVEWRSSQEYPNDFIAREARAADLLILGRDSPSFDPHVFPDRGELLLRVGRPVLVVPPNIESMSGRHVVVAWKDTREARRAVRDALPLLHRAERIVIVEICERSANIPLSEARLRDVSAYLARHRIAAVISERAKPIDRTAMSSLLELVREESADLIVAGAYGHSRLGEWVFGGMTQDLLSGSPFCCLFSH